MSKSKYEQLTDQLLVAELTKKSEDEIEVYARVTGLGRSTVDDLMSNGYVLNLAVPARPIWIKTPINL